MRNKACRILLNKEWNFMRILYTLYLEWRAADYESICDGRKGTAWL